MHLSIIARSLENIAKLFRPKNALLGKVLELSIEEFNFVSFPCQCPNLVSEGIETSTTSSATGDVGLTNSSTVGNTTCVVDNGPNTTAGDATASTTAAPSGLEVITMFNVIITSVSSQAMRKIDPEFYFKCQYESTGIPGADPVAAALGIHGHTFGICKQSIRR